MQNDLLKTNEGNEYFYEFVSNRKKQKQIIFNFNTKYFLNEKSIIIPALFKIHYTE